jgi:hypothetical protein
MMEKLIIFMGDIHYMSSGSKFSQNANFLSGDAIMPENEHQCKNIWLLYAEPVFSKVSKMSVTKVTNFKKWLRFLVTVREVVFSCVGRS